VTVCSGMLFVDQRRLLYRSVWGRLQQPGAAGSSGDRKKVHHVIEGMANYGIPAAFP
jgi:hypothetical protein